MGVDQHRCLHDLYKNSRTTRPTKMLLPLLLVSRNINVYIITFHKSVDHFDIKTCSILVWNNISIWSKIMLIIRILHKLGIGLSRKIQDESCLQLYTSSSSCSTYKVSWIISVLPRGKRLSLSNPQAKLSAFTFTKISCILYVCFLAWLFCRCY